MATVSTGRIYSLSEQLGPIFEEDYDGSSYQVRDYSKVLLKRQDSNGNVTWSREVTSAVCRGYYNDYDNFYSRRSVKPISVFADAQGNVSVLTSYSYFYESYDSDYSLDEAGYMIQKYSASGNYVSEVSFEDDGSSLNPISFAVDGNGNFYVARRDGDSFINTVAKYSTSGAKL